MPRRLTKVDTIYICFILFYDIELHVYINKMIRSCTFIIYSICGFHITPFTHIGQNHRNWVTFWPNRYYPNSATQRSNRRKKYPLTATFSEKALVKSMLNKLWRIYNFGILRKFKKCKKKKIMLDRSILPFLYKNNTAFSQPQKEGIVTSRPPNSTSSYKAHVHSTTCMSILEHVYFTSKILVQSSIIITIS